MSTHWLVMDNSEDAGVRLTVPAWPRPAGICLTLGSPPTS